MATRAKRKRGARAKASATGSGDDLIADFFTTVGALLEAAIRHFKAGDSEGAFEAIGKAVELCEHNPAYALARSSDREISLQQIVHGLLSNAIAKGHASGTAKALLARIQALHAASIH